MSEVKNIQLRTILPSVANRFMRAHHYSGKVVPNSQVHFGAFLDGRLLGVLQFGPCIQKRRTINLVPGTGWSEFIELNRMAFTDALPRNSESRCIAVALKLIKRSAAHIKWVVSFADATQCGTGAIYRASGFKLVGIQKNVSLRELPDGSRMHLMQKHHLKISRAEWNSFKKIPGYQIKYLYKYDGDYTGVKTLPYADLDKLEYPEGVRHQRGLVNA